MASKKMVTGALLIAMSVILTRFLSIRITLFGVEGIRIGIGDVPIVMAGIFGGPLYGAMVGATSDIIGYLTSPMGGAYMPHFTLTSAIEGWLPGMIFIYIFKSSLRFLSVFVSVAVTQFVVSIILVPYFIHSIWNIPYRLLLPSYIISYGIALLVYPIFVVKLGRYVPWMQNSVQRAGMKP